MISSIRLTRQLRQPAFAFMSHLAQHFAKWRLPDDVGLAEAIPLTATGARQRGIRCSGVAARAGGNPRRYRSGRVGRTRAAAMGSPTGRRRAFLAVGGE